jgi:hypothetical protein
MDWSWRCTELNTTVTGSESIRLSCVGLHECFGVCTKGEHERRILSAARRINNAAVLRTVTSSLVTRVRKCFQADGGHFEKFAWMLNGESVTVYLTTYLNKCTMLLFTFQFVYYTLKKLITPEPLGLGPMHIWRFCLRINSGIKSRSNNLNSWDILYK